MSKFEDRLFADLMQGHGAGLAGLRPPTTRHAVPRRVWVTAGTLVAAGVITLGIGLASTGAPAYAVSRGTDGMITVSIWKISGVAGANAELRKLGVPAVAVPMREDCTASLSRDPDAHMIGSAIRNPGDDRYGSVRFSASDIPAGDTLVLAAQQRPDGIVTLTDAFTRGHAPACLPTPPGVQHE